jgi:hypothetical protein
MYTTTLYQAAKAELHAILTSTLDRLNVQPYVLAA